MKYQGYQIILYYIHLPLNEIFGTADTETFAGLTILDVGDFFQLSPIEGLPVYAEYKMNYQNLNPLWNLFELTEVMRQRGDSQLMNLLNNVFIVNLNSHNINMIQSIICAENENANSYNQAMLDSIDNSIHYIKASDNLTKMFQ